MADQRISQERARACTDYFVVSGRTAGRTLHLPAPDSMRDDPKPLCTVDDRLGSDAEWLAKNQAMYPLGYRPICRDCRWRLAEEQDS